MVHYRMCLLCKMHYIEISYEYVLRKNLEAKFQGSLAWDQFGGVGCWV